MDQRPTNPPQPTFVHSRVVGYEPGPEIAIHVTAEHIRLGKPKSCEACPAYLALLDSAKLHPYSVGRYQVYAWDTAGTFWQFATPDNLWDFITTFDREATFDREPTAEREAARRATIVQPFTFTLSWRTNRDEDSPHARLVQAG